MNKSKTYIFELTPKRRFLIFTACFLSVILLGVVGVGRSELLAIFLGGEINLAAGLLLMTGGVLGAASVALLIMRQVRLLVTPPVIDSSGTPVEVDKGIHIGALRFRPIAFISFVLLISAMLFGLGFAMAFEELMSYMLTIAAIGGSFLIAGLALLSMSFAQRRTSRKFGFVASLICAAVVVLFALRLPPVIHDINIGRENAAPVTAEVISVERANGRLYAPGVMEVDIKSTSGEIITLRCPISARELETGKRYTFYYLPKTKLSERWTEARPVDITLIPTGTGGRES